jgi:hypothetical protein
MVASTIASIVFGVDWSRWHAHTSTTIGITATTVRKESAVAVLGGATFASTPGGTADKDRMNIFWDALIARVVVIAVFRIMICALITGIRKGSPNGVLALLSLLGIRRKMAEVLMLHLPPLPSREFGESIDKRRLSSRLRVRCLLFGSNSFHMVNELGLNAAGRPFEDTCDVVEGGLF